MNAPFVGRRSELDLLASLVRRARLDRAPIAALITGEPGCGKSSLLGEFLAEARALAAPARSVRVAGFEPMQSVPLAAVGDLLRQLAKAPGDGAVLDRLVFGGPEAQDRDPLRIFEAAHRALVAAGPILIVIDDLQWADERSLALLHYVLHAAASTHQPIGVIAASRPSPAAAAFRASLAADLPADRHAFMELGPLAIEDGRRLARSIDRDLDEAAAGDLWRRAAGSPFWVEALARTRASADPSSLINDRLRDLGPDASALLAALAVGARPFADDETADLLDWEIDRVRLASNELVVRGLALAGGGTTRVAHDLIREAATRALPTSARRRLHTSLGTWIEASAGDDLPMLREALDHRAAAGLPMADLATRLLASPRRRLLSGDDLRLLASISDALDRGDPGRLPLDRSLAELAAVLGEQELAERRWSSVGDVTQDPRERQHAETEAARASFRLGRSTESHAHIDRARQAWPAEGHITVQIDALEGEIDLWLDHETAAGSATAARALAGARALATTAGGIDNLAPEGRRAYLAALVVAGDAALQEDRADEVINLSGTILQVAEGLDDESHVAALIRTGFALRPLGRNQESVARYRMAWDLSRQFILPILTLEAGNGLARGLRDMGRLIEAREIATETGRLEARITNAPRRWGSAASMVHTIDLSLGDPAAALRALRHDAETEPDPHYRLAIHETLAMWQARLAGPKVAAEVDSELASARAASALARCPRCAAELVIVSADALARIGQVDAARDALALWDDRSTRVYLQRKLWRMRATASIAIADGDVALAVSILERYAEDLDRAHLFEDLLWARVDLGRVLARSDRARAVAAFTEAGELAERIGANSQARLVAQALRRLGVRVWRRGRATDGNGLASLSRREREIAGLVADGGSNREIAETLLVSPKTVERHVTNILAKLGLRNRTEVASLIRSGVVRGSPDE
ncbi:MAG: transcriptional regulator, LuxR family [Chloroflexi bacterium]|nr:transcriptional regulator, LuxR family [Chloroflexota bacterium]